MFERSWHVLVPMCALQSAKTRLAPLGHVVRRELALAMLLDTLAATAQSGVRLHLVTADAGVIRAVAATDLPAQVHHCPGRGLNHDLRGAALHLSPGPAAVLLGDLPTLRPEPLADALTRARRFRSAVVADAAGTGTTLLTAKDRHMLRPAFGPDSLRRHRAAGAELLDADEVLRRDVDVPADVWHAHELGVGRHTASVIRHMLEPIARGRTKTACSTESSVEGIS